MERRTAIDWENEAYNRGLRGETVEFICRVGELLTEDRPFPTAAVMDEAARSILADDSNDTTDD